MKDENSSFHLIYRSTLPTILPASCDAFKLSLYPTILASFFFTSPFPAFSLSLTSIFFFVIHDNFVRFLYSCFNTIFKSGHRKHHMASKIFYTKKQTKWPITQRNKTNTPLLDVLNARAQRIREQVGAGFRGKCVGWSSGLCVGGRGFRYTRHSSKWLVLSSRPTVSLLLVSLKSS